MTAKEKEELVALCERAVDEQDPNKLMALIAKIDHLLEVRQQGLGTSNPASLQRP
jgi:hypothetical protein